MNQQIYLPTGPAREVVIGRLTRMLSALPAQTAFRVSVEEHRPKRSLSQNATMWMLYDQILKKSGELLAGFDAEEVHEFLLGSWSGWETVEMFGRKRVRPLKRSAKLNKQEFSDYLEFIARYMAEKGILLDMPGDTQWT